MISIKGKEVVGFFCGVLENTFETQKKQGEQSFGKK